MRNRRLTWSSGALDEIDAVYWKAEENEVIGAMLEQLEQEALREAEAAFDSGLIKRNGFSSEIFNELTISEKEFVIVRLANGGVIPKKIDIASVTITMRLTPIIQQIMACTIFDILNRLEKLDGALNIIHPNWTLLLEEPLGGRNGLTPWIILITACYPWITISETSSNELSASLAQRIRGTAAAEPSVSESALESPIPADENDSPPAADELESEKTAFWKKWF